jgi:hypothetical protein
MTWIFVSKWYLKVWKNKKELYLLQCETAAMVAKPSTGCHAVAHRHKMAVFLTHIGLFVDNLHWSKLGLALQTPARGLSLISAIFILRMA